MAQPIFPARQELRGETRRSDLAVGFVDPHGAGELRKQSLAQAARLVFGIRRRSGLPALGLGLLAAIFPPLGAAKKYPVHSDPTACSRARLGMRI